MNNLGARTAMVQSQLAPSGIVSGEVLDAFGAVPREWFVPVSKGFSAYADTGVDLGEGRYVLAPLLQARMIQEAGIASTDHVMVLGGTIGYMAAIVARLAAVVTDVECDDRFGVLAYGATAQTGSDNVTRIVGSLTSGVPTPAPVDVIIVDGGAVSVIPSELCARLKPGGRLICIMVPDNMSTGQMMQVEKLQNGTISSRVVMDAWAPYLLGHEPVQKFVFG